MVERICSQCQHGNPIENRYCGRCGAALAQPRALPDPASTHALAPAAPQLPAEIRQIGATLAVGLAALAAEAGMAWLRRRVERIGTPAPPSHHALLRTAPIQATPPQTLLPPGAETIMRQQVIEIWEEGSLKRQIVERAIWQRTRS
ncbi:MAG: zinc ribbon domain-containing protein [Chloroflexaceae bacterium]|nr:zinc ribbon domain-containing protein [Chloroflexaceae bacterium]